MLYLIFYFFITSLIFLFFQSFAASAMTYSFFVSVAVILAMTDAVDERRRMLWIASYGILCDVYFGSFFGIHTAFFLIIAWSYILIIKNLLHKDKTLHFSHAFVVVLLAVVSTFAYDRIVGDGSLYSNLSLSLLITHVIGTLIIFFVSIYILRMTEGLLKRHHGVNSKKHL